MSRFDRLQGSTEHKPMTANVRFYCGHLLREDWKSGEFLVPIKEVDGETSWDSPAYDEAVKEANAQHDAQCEAPEHDIRTSMSFNY